MRSALVQLPEERHSPCQELLRSWDTNLVKKSLITNSSAQSISIVRFSIANVSVWVWARSKHAKSQQLCIGPGKAIDN